MIINFSVVWKNFFFVIRFCLSVNVTEIGCDCVWKFVFVYLSLVRVLYVVDFMFICCDKKCLHVYFYLVYTVSQVLFVTNFYANEASEIAWIIYEASKIWWIIHQASECGKLNCMNNLFEHATSINFLPAEFCHSCFTSAPKQHHSSDWLELIMWPSRQKKTTPISVEQMEIPVWCKMIILLKEILINCCV